jgi:hypothetical protein
MTAGVGTLQSNHGFGPFIANQVIVDLTYLKPWLKNAKDLNTFTSPGPGTHRGMNWMMHGELNAAVRGDKLNGPMQKIRNRVNENLMARLPPQAFTGDMRTGFEEISMSNFSNCCCELSKYVRSLTDGGVGMKSKYNPPSDHKQMELI